MPTANVGAVCTECQLWRSWPSRHVGAVGAESLCTSCTTRIEIYNYLSLGPSQSKILQEKKNKEDKIAANDDGKGSDH